MKPGSILGIVDAVFPFLNRKTEMAQRRGTPVIGRFNLLNFFVVSVSRAINILIV
jgi:hypothetical protein